MNVASAKSVIGETLGSYKIVDQLGEGGMGVVYRAIHPLLETQAAVKLLLPEYSRDEELVRRFFNEARAATKIKHPGIVRIFDFGYTEDGRAFIIMEFLEGEPLADKIYNSGNGLSEQMGLRISRQAASALAAAHAAGIVHRDLKPDNIFVSPDPEVTGGERVKVLDFGIAKLTSDSLIGAKSTRTGSVLGSPAYMSPEQGRGAGNVDPRSDIYSLGCVMFEVITGRPPYEGGGIGEVIAKHIYEPVPSPKQYAPHLSDSFSALIMRCLAKEREERYASMDELKHELDALLGGRGDMTESGIPVQSAVPMSSAPVVRTPAPTNAPANHAVATGSTMAAYGTQAPVAAVPTHGGNSAYMSAIHPPAPKGRGVIVASVLIALLAIGGGVGFLVLKGGNQSSASPAAANPENPVTQPAAPEKVEYRLATTPSGAKVYRVAADGKESSMGTTDLEFAEQKSDQAIKLVLRLDGYDDVEVSLPGDRSSERVLTLKKKVAASKKPARSKKRTRRTRRIKPVKKDPVVKTQPVVKKDPVIKTEPKKSKKTKPEWGGLE